MQQAGSPTSTAGHGEVGSHGLGFKALVATVLAVFAILPLGLLFKAFVTRERPFLDFFSFWSCGRYLFAHPAASLYDSARLHAFQVTLGLPRDTFFPFDYPPVILLILPCLGAMPYGVAWTAWIGSTFAGYFAALRARRWPRAIASLVLLAPSTVACGVCGQNGFLTAALMLGGAGLLATRPFIAGLLLGGLVYKPQFALLIPFLLLFGRRWRAIGGAALSVGLLCAAATLTFGWEVWRAWLSTFQAHLTGLAGGSPTLLDLSPTVTSAVRLWGGGQGLARAAQLIAAGLSVLALWRVRDRSDGEAQAVLPVASLLATPYAFYYDLPMVSGAVLLVMAVRVRSKASFGPAELALMVLALLTPAILLARPGLLSSAAPVVYGLLLLSLSRSKPASGSVAPGGGATLSALSP